jgi:hypothetical protein
LYWDSYLDVYRALKGFSLDANATRQIFDLYWDSYLDVYRALKGFSLDANATTLESSSPEEDSSDD